jgi:hypothetical protein
MKLIVIDGRTRILGRNETLIVLLRKHDQMERTRVKKSAKSLRRQESAKSVTLKAA